MANLALPPNLPVPEDDGACAHLEGTVIPPTLALQSTGTSSNPVNLSGLPGLTVVFCYPGMGNPNKPVPPEWDAIPGARGCTPQACAFRDSLPRLTDLGVNNVFGISTDEHSIQREATERLHLRYPLLCDRDLKFQEALQLPTLEWEGERLLCRVTLAIEGGKVVKWWYPVFPSNKMDDVLQWLETRE